MRPNLETILITFPSPTLTPKGSSKSLELAKNLKEFDGMYLDEDDYRSILRSIQSRAKPCIVRVERVFNVPENIAFDAHNFEMIEFDEFNDYIGY